MTNQNFQYRFITTQQPDQVFDYLTDPENWWVGLFGELIEGESNQINDEFSFKAGDGVHYSRQKLVEHIPSQKIVWLVTESKLSFLNNVNEWEGTKICFEIEEADNKTIVTFMHQGLVPQIECYNGCAGAWTRYLQNLEAGLQ